MKTVKIKSIPANKPNDFFNRMIQYPNLVSNIYSNGLINSDVSNTIDEDITSSMGPVDREQANITAEKNEVVIKPDMAGMYKITGKTHANGGTPLAAAPGSFIFSNSPKLAFTDKQKEMFQFKKGGKTKDSNTPASVLKREVDPKEYNKMVGILDNSKLDGIAKTTAAIMLQKMQAKTGQVALLQEIKKGLPNGLPDFATAPPGINLDDLSDIAQKQYMKNGGQVYDYGGDTDERCPCGGVYPNCIPCTPAQTAALRAKAITGTKNDINGMNFIGQVDNGNLYHTGTDPINIGGPQMSDANWTKFKRNESPQHKADRLIRQKAGTDKLVFVPEDRQPAMPIPNYKATNTLSLPNRGNPSPSNSGNANYDSIPWNGFKFNPNSAEMLSIVAPGLGALATPTYYDMLTQKYTPNIRLDRVDNTQETNDIKSMSNLASQEAYANAPSNIAGAISAQAKANATRSIGQSDQGIRQANTQISNQEEMFNAQNKASDNVFNLQNIHQTYNNNILSQQRRGEMRLNAANQVLNNGLAVKKNLDTLGYAATAAALPSLTNMKDENGNLVLKTGPDGKQYTTQGVPIGFNQNRMPIFDPRFGGLDSFMVNQYAQVGTGADINTSINELMLEAIRTKDKDLLNAAARAAYSLNRPNTKGASALQNILQSLVQSNTQ